ncbi:MAG TPA: carotenoid 1,2-hydratase [Janthinobacterium sp.]|jgi:predicted secreted hydrolase|nr:carotenoid 1,2-hydratase [Janthinobacterium sp.]
MRLLILFILFIAQAAMAKTALARAPAPAFAPVQALPAGQALPMPASFGAHPDFRTEWWYATGWLQTADGKPLGFQVTFFRSATAADRGNPSAFAPKQLIIGHTALSDPAEGKLLHDQKSARQGFGLAYAKVGDTDVKLDDWRMRRGADGIYRVSVRARDFSLTLQLAPTQAVLLQGERGYSRKGPKAAQASFYYSQPQLKTSGSIARRGGKAESVGGVAWLDHEWSSEALDPGASGWDWIGANLDDGGALMAFQIRSKTGAKLWAHATLRDASGKITQYLPEQVSFAPQAHWRSPRTNAEYPVATELTTGATVWQIKPLQDDQELDSRRSTGAVYWEGAVTISRGGVPAGRAYLEMTGYDKPMKL